MLQGNNHFLSQSGNREAKYPSQDGSGKLEFQDFPQRHPCQSDTEKWTKVKTPGEPRATAHAKETPRQAKNNSLSRLRRNRDMHCVERHNRIAVFYSQELSPSILLSNLRLRQLPEVSLFFIGFIGNE